MPTASRKASSAAEPSSSSTIAYRPRASRATSPTSSVPSSGLPAGEALPVACGGCAAVHHVVAVVLRPGGAGMVGQDSQPRPDGQVDRLAAVAPRDRAVLLVRAGDDQVGDRAP